jgi:Histidine kinase-, DNA gyrase B-, and HSP90-like ATPase
VLVVEDDPGVAAQLVRALTRGGYLVDHVATGAGVLRRRVARVTVSDNGHGMSKQQRAAFRRFASGTAGGTGLGLAIADRLAVANRGPASLSDTPGGGLTVTIEFPLAGPPSGTRRPAGHPAGTSAPSAPSARPGSPGSPGSPGEPGGS